jgi:hypothetical protein
VARTRRQAAAADADLDHEALLEAGGTIFRVVRIPLTLDDGATIGWLDLGNALDTHYAEMLDSMSRARTAIVHGGTLVATTDRRQARFQALLRTSPPGVEAVVDGASHVYREMLASVPRRSRLSSVDDAAAAALAA